MAKDSETSMASLEAQNGLFGNMAMAATLSVPQPILRLRDDQLTGCAGCVFREACGGLDQNAVWGCFTTCFSTCDKNKCDYTCPSRPRQLARRIQEVGGFDVTDYDPLTVPSVEKLPRYVPVIYSGSCREEVLDVPVVALPLQRVVRLCQDGRYGPILPDADALRDQFRLSAKTQILITSVAVDRHLERYWRYGRLHRTPEQLATLDLIGMTVPNYSYFTDAPRTDILFNRRRAMLVAGQLSAAGVAVIPHLNALTQGDWEFWAKLLRDQSHIRFVSKEFQTGLSRPESGRGCHWETGTSPGPRWP